MTWARNHMIVFLTDAYLVAVIVFAWLALAIHIRNKTSTFDCRAYVYIAHIQPCLMIYILLSTKVQITVLWQNAKGSSAQSLLKASAITPFNYFDVNQRSTKRATPSILFQWAIQPNPRALFDLLWNKTTKKLTRQWKPTSTCSRILELLFMFL